MDPPATKAYTDEELQLEANKYKRRVDFSSRNMGAYLSALRRGLLDQICAHMKSSRGSSTAERELLSIIKSVYPGAKKLKDMKVLIPEKSHIRGFEMDILVGKLGIEFDGDYYHSFEYMRACPQKKLWSDDDIRNYHPIKDSWFASKGIRILHIKEQDWIDDKETCIRKCMEFLNNG
jgi:hypothetical protein